MSQLTYEQLQGRFKQLGFVWPDLHLIGVRSKEDEANSFDDHFYLINGTDMYVYPGTTNPGLYWLHNPMNIDGAAIMATNQQCVDAYVLGRHKGVHKAWIQAKPIYFFRDNDKDNKSEEQGKKIFQVIGANIHRASNSHTSLKIDKWSAGCQVFADPVHHNQFIHISEVSKRSFFTYTLLKE
jgi:hypothetical protein